MKHLLHIVSAATLAFVAIVCTGSATGADQAPQPPSTTFSMHAENNSKLEGVATVTDAGDAKHPAVSVTLLYANTMFIPETQYPTEIRLGHCGDVSALHAYPLNPVQSGRSSTTIKGVTFAKLTAHPYSINVHAANAIERYLSCGEIVPPPPPTPGPNLK